MDSLNYIIIIVVRKSIWKKRRKNEGSSLGNWNIQDQQMDLPQEKFWSNCSLTVGEKNWQQSVLIRMATEYWKWIETKNTWKAWSDWFVRRKEKKTKRKMMTRCDFVINKQGRNTETNWHPMKYCQAKAMNNNLFAQ